jgi:hypothetical protein
MAIIPVPPRDLKPLFLNNNRVRAFMKGMMGNSSEKGKKEPVD